MKEKLSFNINIPKPCNQNWDVMAQVDGGKQCTQCNNVVYDFSQMTDDEVIGFFKQKPNTHCGRFHNSQLNRAILPVVAKRKLLLNRFNKIAVAFFTVLSFRSLSSNAAIKNVNSVTAFDARFHNKNFTGTDKIVITGTIKDSHGTPLEKATIMFDSLQVAITDKDGKFSFELEEVNATSHHLYFNYTDLITVVRNYHPAMLSTNYEVILNKKGEIGEGFHTMGIVSGVYDFPAISFRPGQIKLNNENKSSLNDVAMKLKNNPSTRIEIVAYMPEYGLHPDFIKKRFANIIRYLVQKQGISSGRLSTSINPGVNVNTIEFKNPD
jgi:hypothetical protein